MEKTRDIVQVERASLCGRSGSVMDNHSPACWPFVKNVGRVAIRDFCVLGPVNSLLQWRT